MLTPPRAPHSPCARWGSAPSLRFCYLRGAGGGLYYFDILFRQYVLPFCIGPFFASSLGLFLCVSFWHSGFGLRPRPSFWALSSSGLLFSALCFGIGVCAFGTFFRYLEDLPSRWSYRRTCNDTVVTKEIKRSRSPWHALQTKIDAFLFLPETRENVSFWHKIPAINGWNLIDLGLLFFQILRWCAAKKYLKNWPIEEQKPCFSFYFIFCRLADNPSLDLTVHLTKDALFIDKSAAMKKGAKPQACLIGAHATSRVFFSRLPGVYIDIESGCG